MSKQLFHQQGYDETVLREDYLEGHEIEALYNPSGTAAGNLEEAIRQSDEARFAELDPGLQPFGYQVARDALRHLGRRSAYLMDANPALQADGNKSLMTSNLLAECRREQKIADERITKQFDPTYIETFARIELERTEDDRWDEPPIDLLIAEANTCYKALCEVLEAALERPAGFWLDCEAETSRLYVSSTPIEDAGHTYAIIGESNASQNSYRIDHFVHNKPYKCDNNGHKLPSYTYLIVDKDGYFEMAGKLSTDNPVVASAYQALDLARMIKQVR